MALVSSAVVAVGIVEDYPAFSRWLVPVVMGLSSSAAGALVVFRLVKGTGWPWMGALAASVGVLALLAAPLTWAAIPVLAGGEAGLPFAGPALLPGRPTRSLTDSSRLAAYLLSENSGETFLAATLNANTAAPLIL